MLLQNNIYAKFLKYQIIHPT